MDGFKATASATLGLRSLNELRGDPGRTPRRLFALTSAVARLPLSLLLSCRSGATSNDDQDSGKADRRPPSPTQIHPLPRQHPSRVEAKAPVGQLLAPAETREG